ncbi:hypothetical protein Vadar_013771 [Vaccinium darrowii]|uniref:Uncharacterized protein n=1 Tax=Vaccinium darrowii TaxID=229202 RepID=A0ACB7ZC00_9ERIC|nr:hypothetical protein Vadar_013771 [Vaccinium darrowii]
MASIDCLPTLISITAILISTLILALLSVKLLSTILQGKNKKKYHPVGGTIFNQLLNFNRLHHYMTDLASKYKTYRLISPFRNEIYTSDPANVEHMLKTNFDNYGKNLFMKSTLDSIFKVAFGVELDSMCGSSEEGTKFSTAFDDSSAVTLRRYVDVFWNIKKAVNIGAEAELKKNIKVLDDFVYKLIRSKAKQMDKLPNDDSSAKKEDILSRFLQVHDETDPKYLRDIILNFISAGKDTTAVSLSWFIYMLCKHPHIQEKVAQEIKDATNIKEGTDFEEFASSIREEALEKMQYLHATLTESLRLYPAVPVDAKICFSDDTWPDGFSVRKGNMVAYQPYAMGRMKFIWGDDAEEFRPERWLDQNGIFQPESPFKFTAFQAGPRIFLGKEFAYRQMKIFSAVLLGFFMFKLSDDKNVVNYRTMINLHIDGGLHVRAFCRLCG